MPNITTEPNPMTSTARVFYTAKAHTTGGREGGASRTDDRRLDVKICPYSKATRGNIDVALAVV